MNLRRIYKTEKMEKNSHSMSGVEIRHCALQIALEKIPGNINGIYQQKPHGFTDVEILLSDARKIEEFLIGNR